MGVGGEGVGGGSGRRGEREHCREGDPLMPQQCYNHILQSGDTL